MCLSAPSSAPTMLSATPSVLSVDLTWSAIPQIDVNGVFQQYVITYSTTGSSSTPSTTTSQKTSITINGLMFGTQYSFGISVVASGGTGPPAMIFTNTTQDGKTCFDGSLDSLNK